MKPSVKEPLWSRLWHSRQGGMLASIAAVVATLVPDPNVGKTPYQFAQAPVHGIAFFHSYDILYAWLALAAIAIDRGVLQKRLSPVAWYRLRWPAIFLHELAHATVATLLGGNARFESLRPRLAEDGRVEGGSVSWGPVAFGGLGHLMAKLAPLAFYPGAALLAAWVLGQPQTLLHGLGWLALILTMIEAAQMISPCDLSRIGIVWVVLIAFGLLGLGSALIHGQALVCESFGVACQGMRP